jgi:hypothetical protein
VCFSKKVVIGQVFAIVERGLLGTTPVNDYVDFQHIINKNHAETTQKAYAIRVRSTEYEYKTTANELTIIMVSSTDYGFDPAIARGQYHLVRRGQ